MVYILAPEIFETGLVELALLPVVHGEFHRYFKDPYTHYSIPM